MKCLDLVLICNVVLLILICSGCNSFSDSKHDSTKIQEFSAICEDNSQDFQVDSCYTVCGDTVYYYRETGIYIIVIKIPLPKVSLENPLSFSEPIEIRAEKVIANNYIFPYFPFYCRDFVNANVQQVKSVFLLTGFIKFFPKKAELLTNGFSLSFYEGEKEIKCDIPNKVYLKLRNDGMGG